MRKIMIMCQKGGAGKTTLAVHLAVALQNSGIKSALVDTDPQGSANAWARARSGGAPPPVAHISATDLPAALAAAERDGYQAAIVDTAPHASPTAARIAALSDLIIIPVRPSAFDLSAAGASVDIARAAGKPAVIILSACPLRAPEIQMARRALGALGLPILNTEIGERRAFSRAVSSGRAVCEFQPDGQAANEVRQLVQELALTP